MAATYDVSGGTITAEFTQNIIGGATIYTLVSVSSSGIEINDGLTIPFSVTARPSSGFNDWFNPLAWDDGGALGIAVGAITVVELVGDIGDGNLPALVRDSLGVVNSLEKLGPTTRTLFSTDIATLSYRDTSFKVSAQVDATYDVTIGDGAQIVMDQNNVEINSLTIAGRGTLLAGLDGFTVDRQFVNDGSLEIVAGPGGAVQGAFENFGNADIGGKLTAQSIDNAGTLSILGTTFSDFVPTTNNGTIQVLSTLQVRVC